MSKASELLKLLKENKDSTYKIVQKDGKYRVVNVSNNNAMLSAEYDSEKAAQGYIDRQKED